jgi:hypothetical protein
MTPSAKICNGFTCIVFQVWLEQYPQVSNNPDKGEGKCQGKFYQSECYFLATQAGHRSACAVACCLVQLWGGKFDTNFI